MTIQVNNAHTIKLSYSGYGKYTATWKGYFRYNLGRGPIKQDTIRKTIHVDSSYHFEKAGLEAAELFTQWLTDTSSHEITHNRCIVESVTMGELSADKRVVLVRTDWIKESI